MKLLLAMTGLSAAISYAQQPPMAFNEIRGALIEVREIAVAEYEDLLAESGGASGVVTLSFTIDPGGTVSGLEAACDPGLRPVADAIEAAVADIDFSSGSVSGPIRISVPFQFTPSLDLLI